MPSLADRDLIERRRRALRHLPLATWLLPTIWIVLGVMAGLRFPALVDPIGVHAELSSPRMDWALVRTLARMAPILFLLLLFSVTATLVWFLRLLHRERHLLDLLDRCAPGEGAGGGALPCEEERRRSRRDERAELHRRQVDRGGRRGHRAP